MRREFIIDGEKFNDMEGFYREIDLLFTKNLNWDTGHNLDAFNDILRGGFGVHEYGEPIKIIWKNFEKSRKDFGDERDESGETLMDAIVRIILDTDDSGHDCVLETIG